MTHYETLGVTPTATPSDIKKAYRAKARNHHPDKGGSDADFADLANAYETLIDPSRKLLYDATGQDRRPPIEKEIENNLMRMFHEALTQDDIGIIEHVQSKLDEVEQRFAPTIHQIKAVERKLKAKRGKIKATGTNLAHLIIDGELRNIEAQHAQVIHQMSVHKGCVEALAAYSDEPDPLTTTAKGYRMVWSPYGTAGAGVAGV
jgi:curved DNA-binding protein CbpA